MDMAKDARVNAPWQVESECNLILTIFNASGTLVMVMDPDGVITRFNKTCEKVTGYSFAEVKGRKAYEMSILPRDLDWFEPGTGHLKPGCPDMEKEVQLTTRQGETRTICWTPSPQLDSKGNLEYLVCTGIDITQRRSMESQLSLLSGVVKQATEIVIITDPSGNIEYVNPAFEKITGYSSIEASGKNPRFLRSGRQDAAFYKNLWETLMRKEPWTGRLINRKKDGTFYEEEANIFPLLDEKGRICHFVKMSKDVSIQIRLEGQLHQAQKMEAIGRLAGGIAHDFNNMLTGIIGNAEILKSKLNLDDGSKDFLREIINISEKAAALSRQLLTFSKLSTSSEKPININNAIAGLDRMIRRVIGEDIDFRTILHSRIPPVKLDPSHLDQIVLNLAINSRDAMPRGGTLVLETSIIKAGEDTVLLHPELKKDSYVLIRVTDSGTGMDEETASHIFEPFFTTKKGKGTGLGLSTVYAIVRKSGGTILVDSMPGRGTTFKIYLPPCEAGVEAPRVNAAPAASMILGGKEEILVVEDDDVIRKLIGQILSRAGYKVHMAAKGNEAVLIYKGLQKKPALMMIDLVLPDMKGTDLAQVIEKQQPGIPILLTSGYDEDSIILRQHPGTKLEFIKKPFTMGALLGKIRGMLDK
jgi:PAS domain S-box-containing protein